MQVILLENIINLGKIGDIVKVKRGYARNYLIKFEKALNASKENIEIINQIKSKVPNSLFPEHDSDLACPALVTALSSRLEKGISIDNGVMHMMSLAKVPMIVLFGPTNSEKFAPNHDNAVILDSNKLYKTNDMSKIKIEDLIKHIN